jgi:hypothetical protein
VTRINRTFVVAAAAIGMSTGAVAMVPAVLSPTIAVMPTVSAADLADMYNTAQLKFRTGDVPIGLNTLRRLLAANPGDVEALALQALWSDYSADAGATQSALAALKARDPAQAQSVSRALAAIETGVRIGPDPLPGLFAPTTGIVILGTGLPTGGAIGGELTSRLFVAWMQAAAAPRSPIIVSGGNPGIREWLIGRAIAPSRIHVEHRAATTAQSAAFTAGVVADLHLRDVVLVTSPDQVRRAAVDFLVAGVRVVRATTTITDLLGHTAVPAKVDQWDIYLDTGHVLGIADTRA